MWNIMYVECLVGSLTVLKAGNDLRACPNVVSNNISVVTKTVISPVFEKISYP